MNNKKISSQGIRILIGKLVVTLEHFLAILVLLWTVFYLIFNIDTLIDSINQEIFFSSLANFFLSILIGIEISRFLMTHSMLDLIDIFGFLLARKALIPETNSINILIIIISFWILIYIRKEVCKQWFFNDWLLDNKKNNQVI
jgi:hypothetical protein